MFSKNGLDCKELMLKVEIKLSFVTSCHDYKVKVTTATADFEIKYFINENTVGGLDNIGLYD